MFIVSHEDITTPLMDFISIKDPHMNFGFANRIRYNHNEDLALKHKFVREFCVENKISDIIITGDLTDTNDERKWTFKQYFLNKEELLKYKNLNLNLYSIAGNHDMFNGMESTNETVFGELVREDVIKYLVKEPYIKVFRNPQENIDKNICVFGIDYSKHKELVEKELEKINDLNKIEIKIVVLHSHVTPAEIGCTDFTYEYLLKTYPNIDVFICGHYHGGFPTQAFYKKNPDGTDDTSKHVIFINNWSFQRVVRDYYNEMDAHTPEFSRVKIGWSVAYNSFVCSVEVIKIPCKTYLEAFKPKAVDLLKLTKKEQFEFFEKINFEDIPTGSDDNVTLNNIGVKENIDTKVINLALKYLNEVNINYED